MVQLSVEGGHFTSAEKVGDDTRRVKYLRIALQLQGMCRKEPHLQSYFQDSIKKIRYFIISNYFILCNNNFFTM